MTSPETSGGTPATNGGHGGDRGEARAGFLPPLDAASGMPPAVLAVENARRAELGRARLAQYGRADDRFKVHCALLRAALDDDGNVVRLAEAVRDSRDLHSDDDPRRIAPLPSPYPMDPLDARNSAARTIAYRVLEGTEELPAPGEFFASLSLPRPDRAPPSDGVPPLGRQRLANAVVGSLDRMTEVPVAGWPAYVVPWQHTVRERAAMLLVGRARAALDEGRDPVPALAGLAAVVVLERDAREPGWRDETWSELRRIVAESAGAPIASAVLRFAIDEVRPGHALAELVVATARGDVPSTPEGVAILADRVARALGCLSAKTIDADPIRRGTRSITVRALTDPTDGLLMASVLRGLHPIAAWPDNPWTARIMLASCPLRAIVTGSPSAQRRGRAALGIAMLARWEARDRGSDAREATLGSQLADRGIGCSAVLAEVLADGELSDPVRAVVSEVMEGRGGEDAELAERIRRLVDGEAPAEPSLPASDPGRLAGQAVAPAKPAQSAAHPVRLFPFKESLHTASGAPRERGYVKATLVRSDGRSESVRLGRKLYDGIATLAKDRVLALTVTEGSRRALDRLKHLLDSWGVETMRDRPNVLVLEGSFNLHPADGAENLDKTARRLVREIERDHYLGQS